VIQEPYQLGIDALSGRRDAPSNKNGAGISGPVPLLQECLDQRKDQQQADRIDFHMKPKHGFFPLY
jgi:hypothetical protein